MPIVHPTCPKRNRYTPEEKDEWCCFFYQKGMNVAEISRHFNVSHGRVEVAVQEAAIGSGELGVNTWEYHREKDKRAQARLKRKAIAAERMEISKRTRAIQWGSCHTKSVEDKEKELHRHRAALGLEGASLPDNT